MQRLGHIVSHIQPQASTMLQTPVAGLDSKRFKGQIAIVTGGANGIGLAIAERLGLEGATVVLFDLNSVALGDAVKALKGKSISASGIAVDVTDEGQVASAFAKVEKEHGRLDVLVQAAGITGKTGVKTQDVDLKDFQKVFAVNNTALFLGARAALPIMLKRNYGRIINVASVAGKEGNAGMLAYSASKAAVIGLTKVIGKEYAETGITCNALAPAVVRTAMVDAMPESQVKYMTDKIPMKRCGTLDEIGGMVAFIASPEASFTTAFTFDATGGRATY